jgi:transcription antitermination factor NusG
MRNDTDSRGSESDDPRPARKRSHDFILGQRVKVVAGPYTDFIASVTTVDQDHQDVGVVVGFRDREVPLRLSILDVVAPH